MNASYVPGSGPYLKNKEHLFEWYPQICDVITSSATNWGMNQRGERPNGRGLSGDWCYHQGRDDDGMCENSPSVGRRGGDIFHGEN